MATFTFEVKKAPNRFGRYQIFLRITENRKHERVKMAISVARLSDFNPKAKNNRWIRQTEPNYKQWNEDLALELEKAQKAYRELANKGIATKEGVARVMAGKDNRVSFLAYAKDRTQQIYTEGGIRNYKKYNGFCNKLEGYLNSRRAKDLLFAELTPTLLEGFNKYLHTLRNELEPEKTLHPNTIAVNLNIFKTLVNKGIAEGHINPQKNPFLGFSYKTIKTVKEKLTEEEIAKIKALDLVEGTRVWDARNFFLFSYYCAGIRAGDFIQLRWGNITPDGRLVYVMDKNHKKRDLKLLPPALDILGLYSNNVSHNPNGYIFPLLDDKAEYARFDIDTIPSELKEKLYSDVSAKTSIINNNLKKIKELAGIEKKLTFHIARHSFASVAKEKGVSSAEIKGILAHTNLSTTEKYMGEFDTAKTDKTLENVFGAEDNTTSTLMGILNTLTEEQKQQLIEQLQTNK